MKGRVRTDGDGPKKRTETRSDREGGREGGRGEGGREERE